MLCVVCKIYEYKKFKKFFLFLKFYLMGRGGGVNFFFVNLIKMFVLRKSYVFNVYFWILNFFLFNKFKYNVGFSIYIKKKRFNSNIIEYVCNGKEKLYICYVGFFFI